MSTTETIARPIRSLPSGDAGGAAADVMVNVVPMTYRVATQWHSQVQPLIDANYVHAAEARAGQGIRADVGWDWPKYWLLAGAHSFFNPALALSLVLETEGTGPFPIGMLTVVPRLRCAVFGEERSRSFTWYAAGAPSEVYEHVLGRPAVKAVMNALLDCGIQAALDLGEDGSSLLHADPNGGEQLALFYRDRVGMQQVPASSVAVTFLRRNDPPDEYFHFDSIQAAAFCARFDKRR